MYYTIYFGVYNSVTSMYDYSTLLIAPQPSFNNFRYNLTGLVLNQRYSFKHSATNNYGTSYNSSEVYIRPGYGPLAIGFPSVYLYGENIGVSWYSTFVSEYDIDSFELLFLSSSNNWYELPIFCGPEVSY
jgi:hypothetical protein